MADDAVIQLVNGIRNVDEDETNKAVFLKGVDDTIASARILYQVSVKVIGLAASAISPVASALVSAVVANAQGLIAGNQASGVPGDKEVLTAMADLLNLVGLIEAEAKVKDLTDKEIHLDDAVDLLIKYGPTSQSPNLQMVSPAEYDSSSLDLVNELASRGTQTDKYYWYRGFDDTRAFREAYTTGFVWWPGPYSGGADAFKWKYDTLPSGNRGLIPPTDKTRYPGHTVVFDPQYALPAYLKAVQSLLTIHVLLDEEPHQFLAKWQADFIKWADALEFRYNIGVGGLVKTDIPTENDVLSALSDPRFSLYYGVVDIYGVYKDPIIPPSKAASHIIESFPVGIIKLFPDDSDRQRFENFVYTWFKDRVTLGLMARWKAIYLMRGYDKAWSALQNLRILAKQQSGLLNDSNKNWSARELFRVLSNPTSPENPGGWIGLWLSLSDLVNRLDRIAKGTWSVPSDDVSVDNLRKRPIGFRDRLAASAL